MNSTGVGLPSLSRGRHSWLSKARGRDVVLIFQKDSLKDS